MSDDFDQKLGLDARDYFDEVNRLIAINSKLEKSIISLGKEILTQNKSLGESVLIYEDLKEKNKNFYATLVTLGGKYNEVNQTISITNKSLKEEIDNLELLNKTGQINIAVEKAKQEALKQEARDLDSLVQFQIDFENASKRTAQVQSEEQSLRTKALKEQAALADKLLNDEIKKQEDLLNESRRVRNAQISLIRELQTVQEQSIAEKNAEVLATQRLFAAEQLRSQLSRQFTSPSPANATEVARVAQNIGSITRLVSQGQISLGRATQIIASVQSGSAEAFEGVENQVARSAKGMIQASNSLGAEYTRNINKIESSNNRLKSSLTSVGQESTRSSREILLSWRSLLRIFAIQTIHTAIASLVGEFRQSIDAASQFQIKISEIRTISQDSQLSFSRWGDAARGLSDEFGNPILEVAAGLYETISNQIAKGGDATQFMRSALELAQTTVATTSESVNALSSVLNSYNLSAERSEYVSGVLFKLVDLGRVRLSELGESIGRVTSLAAPLGVSFEEVSAAIATLTIRGVRYNEAYTLINNVLLRLLKPTQGMTKFLHELGFETGQAAIEGLGFEGVLKKIATATNGNVAELASMFNELRGLRGATVLAGTAFGDFQKTLEKIKQSGDEYNIAKRIIPESAGKQFEIEINKLKNLFINDFGNNFIGTLLQLTTAYDENGKKIRGLADTVLAFKDIILTAGVAFISYKSTVLLTALAEQILTSGNYAVSLSMRSQVGVLANLTGAYTALKTSILSASGLLTNPYFLVPAVLTTAFYVWQKHKQALDEVSAAYQNLDSTVAQSVQDQTESIRKELDKQNSYFKEALNDRFHSYLGFGASIRSTLERLTDEEKKKQEEITKNLKDAFDILSKSIENSIKSTENGISAASRNIETLKRQLLDIRDQLGEGRFERQLKGLPEADQITLITNRLKNLKAERNSLLGSTSGDPVKDQEAIEHSIKVSAEVERLTNTLYEKRAEAEKKRKDILDKIQELNAREVATTQIQESIKHKSNLTSELRGEESSRRNSEETDKLNIQLDSYNKMLVALGSKNDFEKSITSETQKQVDLINQQIQNQEKLKQTEQDRLKKQQENLEKAKTIFNELTSKVKLPSQLDLKKDSNPQSYLKEFDSRVGQLSKLGITDPNVYFQIAQRRAELEKQLIIETEKFRISQITGTLSKEKDQLTKNYSDAQKTFSDFTQKRSKSIEKFNNLSEQLIKAQDTSFENLVNVAPSIAGNFKKALEGLSSKLKQGIATPADTATLRAILNGVAKNDVVINKGGFNGAGRLTSNDLVVQISRAFTDAVQSDIQLPGAEKLKNTLSQQLTSKNNQIEKVLEGANIQNATDSYVNSTSQAESEINKLVVELQNAQSRVNRLFPQPTFIPNVSSGSSSNGTSTFNGDSYSFGDINVNVNSSGNAQTDAREIARQLNNEIRKGTVKIRS